LGLAKFALQLIQEPLSVRQPSAFRFELLANHRVFALAALSGLSTGRLHAKAGVHIKQHSSMLFDGLLGQGYAP